MIDVNKIARLAAALFVSVFILAGCSGSDSDSDSGGDSGSDAQTGSGLENTSSDGSGTSLSVRAPVGSITGHVQDTNGNPLEDASVYVAGQVTTTDAGGNYYFAEVQVTQTSKLGDGSGYAQALSITIVPPSGYLGATITVEPAAQIFEGDNDDGSGDGAAQDVTTFIDGFLASAGTASLPALTGTVTGWVRDNTTGEAIQSVSIGLDMLETEIGGGVDQEQTQNGVSTSYQTLSYTATTGSDGSFSITNVPVDSILNYVFTNYTINSNTNVDTSDEVLAINDGEITVTLIESTDTDSPFVERVFGVLAQAAATGQLDDETTTAFVIEFSETMATGEVDANSINVRDVTDDLWLTVNSTAFSTDGQRMTVTLSAAVTAGNTFHINMLKADFMDTAESSTTTANHLATGTGVGYDTDFSTTNGTDYLRLTMRAFEDADATATSPTPAQATVDTLGAENNIAMVQAVSTAFNDVDDDTAGIQQLNSADDDDNLNNDAATRLSALTAALASTVSITGTTTVSTDVARITFTPTVAASYSWEMDDEDGTLVPGVVPDFRQGTTNVTDNGDGTGTFEADTTGDTIEFVLDGVEPDYNITIIPYDEFGYPGTEASLDLVDNVPATTILQSSYAVPTDTDTGMVTSLEYGDGGEQSAGENLTVGTPYLNLTPRLLGEVDGTNDGPNDDADDLNTFVLLYEQNSTNTGGTAFSGANPGDQFIDETNNIYDAPSWVAYLALANTFDKTIGVAFSEDVTLAADPAYTGGGGTITLSNFVAMNDVFREDDGDTPGNGGDPFVDLVRFDVDNVYTMALEDNGAIMDFSGQITDNAGNASPLAANPRVVIRDAIPPMIESAIYDGRNFTITFDKAVDLANDPDIILDADGAGLTIALDDTDNYALTSSDTVLTIDPAAWGGNTGMNAAGGIAAVFDLAAYDESDTTTAPTNGQYGHTEVDYSEINNANEVDWDVYAAAGDFNFENPTFAGINSTENFAVDITSGVTSGLGTATITVLYQLTHEFDMGAVDSDSSGNLDSAEIQGMFTWSGGAVNAAGNSLAISNGADGATDYTFTLSLSANSAATQTLDIDLDTGTVGQQDWTSNYYSGQTVGAGGTQITF